MKSIYTFTLIVAFLSLVYTFSCPEGEKVKLKHDQIEGFDYLEACLEDDWTRPDNFTQKALLGSGMSLVCRGLPRFWITDLIKHQNYGVNEFVYYPYKICLSVFGAKSVNFYLWSEQCGYRKASVTIPTLEWHSFCYEPTGDTLNCGVYHWLVVTFPSKRAVEARVKNAKLVACKQQAPFVCPEGDNIHVEHGQLEGFYYHERCAEYNWTRPDNFLYKALLGSGMTFGCNVGAYPIVTINDAVFHQMHGAYEYAYFPYKICMSVSGTNQVLIQRHSQECGYMNRYTTIPTLGWYSFCWIPYDDCSVHKWVVFVKQPDLPVVTSVKDLKVDSCRLQAPYSCDEGDHVKLVYGNITGMAYRETCSSSGSENSTQNALLGSGTSFDCNVGSNHELEFFDPLFHENNGQYEFNYYPYKICMSVFGVRQVRFHRYSEECGYHWTTKVGFVQEYISGYTSGQTDTDGWHYFCLVPSSTFINCGVYRMVASIEPTGDHAETRVKNVKLDSCRLPAGSGY